MRLDLRPERRPASPLPAFLGAVLISLGFAGFLFYDAGTRRGSGPVAIALMPTAR